MDFVNWYQQDWKQIFTRLQAGTEYSQQKFMDFVNWNQQDWKQIFTRLQAGTEYSQQKFMDFWNQQDWKKIFASKMDFVNWNQQDWKQIFAPPQAGTEFSQQKLILWIICVALVWVILFYLITNFIFYYIYASLMRFGKRDGERIIVWERITRARIGEKGESIMTETLDDKGRWVAYTGEGDFQVHRMGMRTKMRNEEEDEEEECEDEEAECQDEEVEWVDEEDEEQEERNDGDGHAGAEDQEQALQRLRDQELKWAREDQRFNEIRQLNKILQQRREPDLDMAIRRAPMTYLKDHRGTWFNGKLLPDRPGVLKIQLKGNKETVKFMTAPEKCGKCGKSHGNARPKEVVLSSYDSPGWDEDEEEKYYFGKCKKCGNCHEITPPDSAILKQFKRLDEGIQRVVRMHFQLPDAEKLPAEILEDASYDIERSILRAKFADILHKVIFEKNVGERVDYVEISARTLKPIRDEVWAAVRPLCKHYTYRGLQDAREDVGGICRSAYKIFGLAFKRFDWEIEWQQDVEPSTIEPNEMEIVGTLGPDLNAADERSSYIVDKVVFGGIVRGDADHGKKRILEPKVIIDYPE